MSSAADLVLETIPVGPLQCNCTVLGDSQSGEAVVIDPGDEPERILRLLASKGLTPVALLHTRTSTTSAGRDASGGDRRGDPRLHAADFPLRALPSGRPLRPLRRIPAAGPGHRRRQRRSRFGAYAVTAIHTPGHTPGSTCYRLEGATPGAPGVPSVLFSGDTLFRRSIGRTDLWGGDTDTILASIRERLYGLPGDLRVICGHGPDTTIAEERERNPFVRGATL
jgi:glyoxylase-like metal-dependent hydrolase (beta-lactamase superfamily II)